MHPWVWLNEPQHAAAVTALLSLLATVFTGVAAVGAVLAYRESKHQVLEAHEQTALAKREATRQAEVTEVQMNILRMQLKEQLRPILQVREEFPENATLNTPGPNVIIENSGPGTASFVAVEAFENAAEGDIGWLGPLHLYRSVVPPTGALTIAPGYDFTDQFSVFYQSAAGDRYSTTCVRIEGELKVVSHEDGPTHWP